jgi:hypothetical protein
VIEENQLGRRNLSDDQETMIWESIRERRSKVRMQERAGKANDAKYGRASLSETSTDRAKPDSRAEVAREARIPERKLRAAAEVKKALEIQCDALKDLPHVGLVLSHDLMSDKLRGLALRARRPIS